MTRPPTTVSLELRTVGHYIAVNFYAFILIVLILSFSVSMRRGFWILRWSLKLWSICEKSQPALLDCLCGTVLENVTCNLPEQ